MRISLLQWVLQIFAAVVNYQRGLESLFTEKTLSTAVYLNLALASVSAAQQIPLCTGQLICCEAISACFLGFSMGTTTLHSAAELTVYDMGQGKNKWAHSPLQERYVRLGL